MELKKKPRLKAGAFSLNNKFRLSSDFILIFIAK